MRATIKITLAALAAVSLLTTAVALTVGATSATAPTVAACAPPPGIVTTSAAGVPLSPGQIGNAHTIYQVGLGLGLPAQAEIIAIATALQESGLQDLPYGTGTSLGLFQQEAGQGWGTAAQIMDPVTASRSFYLALAQVPGWQTMPLTAAAQAVQHSAFPGAYAKWQAEATTLVASFTRASGSLAGVDGPCQLLGATVAVPSGTPAGGAPAGYHVPAGTPIAVALAIRFAFAQLGTSYYYGGTCTDAHSPDPALHCDCSSLVQQSYHAAGITLPRTTFQQVDTGTPVYSLSDLRPGDLLFLPGADGTPANPGHVGMYVGSGLVIQAPQTGQNVQLSPLSQWASSIVAMRRIVTAW
ncbi:MAG TPA: C40 family peptidase [Streptosporangiaceae bacterium]|nr:C40 family peptidase [Streptosporangiaceae bacterium]